MSQETWDIVTGKTIKEIDLQLALQCAPLIAGLKISNLFNIQREQYKAVKKILSGSHISWYVLLENGDKLMLLLYHARSMEDYLKQPEVRRLLIDAGYESMELMEILTEFSRRYGIYMKQRSNFPHEMGLLLGYPVEDVAGFIEYKGKKSLCTGYWKVYHNVEEKQRIFESFESAEENMIQLLNHGLCMADIINTCCSHRRLSCS